MAVDQNQVENSTPNNNLSWMAFAVTEKVIRDDDASQNTLVKPAELKLWEFGWQTKNNGDRLGLSRRHSPSANPEKPATSQQPELVAPGPGARTASPLPLEHTSVHSRVEPSEGPVEPVEGEGEAENRPGGTDGATPGDLKKSKTL